MMKYKQQIKEYKEEIEKKYLRIEAENRTVKACQNILSESVLSKQSHRTSYFEFLYEQTKFIKKRWWILQGCILMCLWIWSVSYTHLDVYKRQEAHIIKELTAGKKYTMTETLPADGYVTAESITFTVEDLSLIHILAT